MQSLSLDSSGSGSGNEAGDGAGGMDGGNRRGGFGGGGGGRGRRGGGREGRRVRFAGVDGEGPEESIGLDAYVTPGPGGRQRGRRGGSQGSESGGPGQSQSDFEYRIVTCPVCGVFEGDEAAVAHHVAGHFD